MLQYIPNEQVWAKKLKKGDHDGNRRSSSSWGNGEEKKARGLEDEENKIEGSPNDPLYVSKQTYHIVISLPSYVL